MKRLDTPSWAAVLSPRVEAAIERCMREHSGADYYEHVHQEIAPLAREFESALRELVAVKRLKDNIDNDGYRSRPAQDLIDAEADYKRRAPIAWVTAIDLTGKL